MHYIYHKLILLFAFSNLVQVGKPQEAKQNILKDSIQSVQLKEVVAKAPKYGRFSDYSAQTLQMSTMDIVTNPAAMADIIGNMHILPGVQANDHDGRLIIQGGDTNESQIYINDLIVANPYSLSPANKGVRSRFSSDLFEGIALQSGGFNAEFGQALSGIINLNTKEKDHIDSRTDISVSSVYTGITLASEKPSYAYRGNLSYTNLMPYRQIISDGYDWQKHYRQLSFDFFLTREFSSKTKITMQLNSSRAGGTYIYENIDSTHMTRNLKELYLYAQINIYHAISNKLSLSAAGNIVFDRFSGTEMQYLQDRLKTRNIWNHNKITLQYKSGMLVNRTGVELMVNPYKEIYFFDREYSNSVKNNLSGAYNDTKIFITEKLTLSVGLRGEYSGWLNRFNLAPRFYAGYRFRRKHTLSASAGEYFQLPEMNYLKRSDGIDFSSVDKGTISYSYLPKRNAKFQIDAYYKKYKDLVVFHENEYASQGNGSGYGIDLFLKNNYKNMEYWAAYSFNNTKKQYDAFPQAVAPDYLARHSFNATLKYWLAPIKSLLSTNYYISSGVPYYNPSYPYNKAGDTPLHNSLSISWSYLPRPGMVIHFGCQNVFGYQNIYGYEYSTLYPDLKREISNPEKRFLFLGFFMTLSNNKKLNQLKNL